MLVIALVFLVACASGLKYTAGASIKRRSSFALSSVSSGSAAAATLSQSSGSGSILKQLSSKTIISIDSGDLDVLQKWAETGLITDATTNPLFVSQAGQNGDSRYYEMVENALTYAKKKTCESDSCSVPAETLALACDRLAVLLGLAISKIVEGKVSTEVDIRLSYNKEASVERALRIIDMVSFFRRCIPNLLRSARSPG